MPANGGDHASDEEVMRGRGLFSSLSICGSIMRSRELEIPWCEDESPLIVCYCFSWQPFFQYALLALCWFVR